MSKVKQLQARVTGSNIFEDTVRRCFDSQGKSLAVGWRGYN